jgi:hypothetical protein
VIAVLIQIGTAFMEARVTGALDEITLNEQKDYKRGSKGLNNRFEPSWQSNRDATKIKPRG